MLWARIHSQFESLGFVGKYDQSPTKLVNKHWNTGERILCEILGFSPSKKDYEFGISIEHVQLEN
jgi:hypothetical protein